MMQRNNLKHRQKQNRMLTTAFIINGITVLAIGEDGEIK